MTDIASVWDNENACADWAFSTGDLATAPSIESAVRVSLFTERGWWADAYNGRQIGSRLHELDRAKKAGGGSLLLQARDYAREALAWLVEDGIAARVEVRTSWLAADALGIEVVVTQPTGTKLKPFRYSYAWQG